MKNLVAAIIVNILLAINAVFVVMIAVSTENPQGIMAAVWIGPSLMWLFFAIDRYRKIRRRDSHMADS